MGVRGWVLGCGGLGGGRGARGVVGGFMWGFSRCRPEEGFVEREMGSCPITI